ncbi:hypothetical protein SDC9_80262 [bioreactor metagenome]|uniref:Uncharacterized protein n=1 Tax=bioreactor metagenome TaxID=1076179 RepID=A0A644Z6G8_9ZZZZ
MIHPCNARLRVVRQRMPRERLWRKAADVFRIHPCELVYIKDCWRFGHTGYVKRFFEFVQREKLPLVSGIPAKQRNIVDNRFLEVALLQIILKIRVAVPLTEFVARVAHDRRHVNVDWFFPAERLIKQVILRRAGEVLVAAHHVGDRHRVVVDHICKVIRRHAVRLDEHHVVELRAVHADMPVEYVVKRGLARERHVLANHVGLACGDAFLHFVRRKMKAMLVIFPDFALRGSRLPARVQLFIRAEAIVRLAGLDQQLGIRQIHALAFALNIRAVVAADIRAFVPLHADVAERVVDDIYRAFNIAALVGVLDAENERAVVFFCIQIGIQRAAQIAQMHIARRRRGKSGSNHKNVSKLYFSEKKSKQKNLFVIMLYNCLSSRPCG